MSLTNRVTELLHTAIALGCRHRERECETVADTAAPSRCAHMKNAGGPCETAACPLLTQFKVGLTDRAVDRAWNQLAGKAANGARGVAAWWKRVTGGGGALNVDAADPYLVLGVVRGAEKDEVKRRYRDLCKALHPDRNASPDAAAQMAAVNAAYEAIEKTWS